MTDASPSAGAPSWVRLAALAVAVPLGLLFLGLALRPAIERLTPWGQLAQTYPGDGPVVEVRWFRTVYLDDLKMTGTTWVGWSEDALRLNYHLLLLRGSTDVAIPWEAITPRRERVGAADWIALDAGPDAPIIYVRPALAAEIAAGVGEKLVLP